MISGTHSFLPGSSSLFGSHLRAEDRMGFGERQDSLELASSKLLISFCSLLELGEGKHKTGGGRGESAGW